MDRHALLSSFLDRWPPSRLKSLSIDEYVVGGDDPNNSFCYWVETEVKALGNIKGLGGGGSFKFGIFKKVSNKTYSSDKFIDDGVYAWQKVFGLDRESAFDQIRSRIVAIAEYALANEFHRVEEVKDIFTLFKWKVAFSYSSHNLVPIYKRDWLIRIAKSFGIGRGANGIAELQRFIIQQYDHTNDFFQWYDHLLQTHIRSKKRFYVIGSQYYDSANRSYISKLDYFYKESVVATNFGPEISLKEYYGAPVRRITDYLKELGLPTREVTALKCFLSVEPGDIIAVKEFGVPGRLKIASYAEVIQGDDGNVYSYDAYGLGHTVNVRFLEQSSDLELPYSKRMTAHEITDLYEIDEIFGVYQIDNVGARQVSHRNGVQSKSIDGYWRGGTTGRWVNQYHNLLQQKFFERLKILKDDVDGKNCSMEEDYIDIAYLKDDIIELYEVKPFPSPKKCMREAIGQLLAYSYAKGKKMKMDMDSRKMEIKLVVIGPNEMKDIDRRFLEYLNKSLLGFELSYEPFNEGN